MPINAILGALPAQRLKQSESTGTFASPPLPSSDILGTPPAKERRRYHAGQAQFEEQWFVMTWGAAALQPQWQGTLFSTARREGAAFSLGINGKEVTAAQKGTPSTKAEGWLVRGQTECTQN